jgi:putative NIF3 family GTP cyclohydrolase 1 type 2
MHTALDVARGVTNDVLADACVIAIAERRALRPLAPPEPRELGQGRVGDVIAASRREIVLRVKAAFARDPVMVAGPLDAPVHRVAVAAGAGSELLEPAVRAGADIFVTGELRHHDALLAATAASRSSPRCTRTASVAASRRSRSSSRAPSSASR